MNRICLVVFSATLVSLNACSSGSSNGGGSAPAISSSSSSSSSSSASNSSSSSAASSASGAITDPGTIVPGSPNDPFVGYLPARGNCQEYSGRHGFDVVWRCTFNDSSNDPFNPQEDVVAHVEISDGAGANKIYQLHYEEAYQRSVGEGEEALIIRFGYAEGDKPIVYETHRDQYLFIDGRLQLSTSLRAPVDSVRHELIDSVKEDGEIVSYVFHMRDYDQPWLLVGDQQVVVAEHLMQDLESDGICEHYHYYLGGESGSSWEEEITVTDPIFCYFTPETAPIDMPISDPYEKFVVRKYRLPVRKGSPMQ